jgi:hypothetical protein
MFYFENIEAFKANQIRKIGIRENGDTRPLEFLCQTIS